jgi:hypothetical protein
MAFGPAALLAVLVLLTRLLILININPPGDEATQGFVVVALVLGIAGALQRRRRKLFAVPGIVCSLHTFAVVYVGWHLDEIVLGLTEHQPTFTG